MMRKVKDDFFLLRSKIKQKKLLTVSCPVFANVIPKHDVLYFVPEWETVTVFLTYKYFSHQKKDIGFIQNLHFFKQALKPI